MKPLIPLTTRHIGGDAIQTINARDLHAFLEVGKVFAAWIQDRIQQYGFMENQDFEVFSDSGKNLNGGRTAKEYAITLDMAKELAMVERNHKGREARRYFIACEKALREQPPLSGDSTKPLTIAQRANRGIAAARHFVGMLRAADTLQTSRRRAAMAANQATLQVIGMDMLATLGVSPDELDDTPATPTPMQDGSFAGQLQRWLAEPAQARRQQFTSEDIMLGLYGSAQPANQRALATRIGHVMAHLGWPKRRLPPDSHGNRPWVYGRPA